MSFGLRNAAQSLQNLVDEECRSFDFVFVYIEYRLVFSSTPGKHHRHVRQSLQQYIVLSLIQANVSLDVHSFPFYDISLRLKEFPPPRLCPRHC